MLKLSPPIGFARHVRRHFEAFGPVLLAAAEAVAAASPSTTTTTTSSDAEGGGAAESAGAAAAAADDEQQQQVAVGHSRGYVRALGRLLPTLRALFG